MDCTRRKTIILSKKSINPSITDIIDDLNLTPGNNSVGLEKIINRSTTTIDVNLLAIEKTINPEHDAPCKYDKKKTVFSVCTVPEADFAHIYISTNILMRHYIILFANKLMSDESKIKELADKFDNTIKRLKKAYKDFPIPAEYRVPVFCIYFYGEWPNIDLRYDGKYNREISNELRGRFGFSKEELPHCKISGLDRKDKYLTIISENNSLKFTFSHLYPPP